MIKIYKIKQSQKLREKIYRWTNGQVKRIKQGWQHPYVAKLFEKRK